MNYLVRVNSPRSHWGCHRSRNCALSRVTGTLNRDSSFSPQQKVRTRAFSKIIGVRSAAHCSYGVSLFFL